MPLGHLLTFFKTFDVIKGPSHQPDLFTLGWRLRPEAEAGFWSVAAGSPVCGGQPATEAAGDQWQDGFGRALLIPDSSQTRKSPWPPCSTIECSRCSGEDLTSGPASESASTAQSSAAFWSGPES